MQMVRLNATTAQMNLTRDVNTIRVSVYKANVRMERYLKMQFKSLNDEVLYLHAISNLLDAQCEHVAIILKEHVLNIPSTDQSI